VAAPLPGLLAVPNSMTSSDPYGPPQKRSADAELPKFPGERPQQHAGTAWKEIASSRLGAQQLLAVAHGREPAQAAVIIDEPLLPVLAPGHRDHERRVETNNRIGTQNKRNSIRRWYITMGAWTELYNALACCCEFTAPTLFRELLDQCDLEKSHGPGLAGYFDGPLAWRIVLHWLEGGQRTKSDKDYYRTADKLQRENMLRDGCSENAYNKKALAWINQIMPNLAQKYEPADAGEYIIDLMPNRLAPDKRRLKDQLHASGVITNLREVMRLCSAVVFEDQLKGSTENEVLDGDIATIQPALQEVQVESSVVAAFSLPDLSETCGMTLSIRMPAKAQQGPHGAFVNVHTPRHDSGVSWCPGCPHIGRSGKPMVCRKSPYFDKPLPPHLDQNDIEREKIETARMAHAKKNDIEYKPLPRASESDVAKWRESEHASGKTTGMLANSVQKRVNADFTAGLVEFDDPTFMDKIPAGMALSDFALDEYEPECLCGECFGADVAAVATTSPVPPASDPAAATPYSRTPLPSISAEALPELQAQLAARGDGKTVEIPVHMSGGGAASTPSPLALTTRLDDAAAPTTGGPPPTPLPTVPEGLGIATGGADDPIANKPGHDQ